MVARLTKGPWSPEEDHKLITYIESHGHSSWRALPEQAGLSRCGKSCRLRWTNYLRPGIKRGNFSPQEENTILHLHALLGNRWSMISMQLPGRTDNEIKNHWNTRLRKRLLKKGIDPTTHRPLIHHPLPFQTASSINTLLLSLLQEPGHVLQNNAMPAAPPPGALNPALLAAAETRLVLDCLKLNNAANHSSTSDHRLNQLLTRLLLLKLLQGSYNHAPPPSNPAACYANNAPIHNINQQPLSEDRNQGLHPAGTILPAPAPPSAHVNPVDLNDISLPTTMLLNMFSSSYQQRLLQSLPFLAESLMEPCTSATATDHLSSTAPTQLSPPSQASFFNCPPELTTPNGSLTSQHTPLWPGHVPNEVLPNGAQAAAGVMQKQSLSDSQLMASGEQLLAGARCIMQEVVSAPLMTCEEHLMSKQKCRDRDPASSSTLSSSPVTSASECHAAPNTPTHNSNNIQDYLSDLLSLISSTNK